MQVMAGTSGYSYKEWKGVFSPEKREDGVRGTRFAQRVTELWHAVHGAPPTA